MRAAGSHRSCWPAVTRVSARPRSSARRQDRWSSPHRVSGATRAGPIDDEAGYEASVRAISDVINQSDPGDQSPPSDEQ
jgi:hypothetical protein